MTRKIAFDYDRALDAATRLFWERGYASTGLRDLLKAMEIGEGSFYNTLKSKKQLYLACLEHYDDTVVRRRFEVLQDAATAGEGIRAFFIHVLDYLDDPAAPSRLCMIAAMASEEVLSEADLRERATQGLSEVESVLCKRLEEDREQGRWSTTFDPETVAAVITTFLQGLWRMALVNYERSVFERRIETLLSGMGL